jgi:hypothetical protein
MVGYEHLKLALGKVLSIPPWHCTADASSAALSLLIYEYPDVQEHLMQHKSPHAQNTHTHTHVHITHTHAHACTYIYRNGCLPTLRILASYIFQSRQTRC